MNTLAAAGVPALKQLVMITHAGMTTAQFETIVTSWTATARHPRFHVAYPNLSVILAKLARPTTEIPQNTASPGMPGRSHEGLPGNCGGINLTRRGYIPVMKHIGRRCNSACQDSP